MKRIFIAILAAVAALAPAASHAAAPAQPPAEMLRAAYAVADADAAANAGLFRTAMTSNPTIVDEFVPYAWSGAGAIDRYTAALKAWLSANGLADLHVVVDAPRYWDVSGDRGWVSLPATFIYNAGGQANAEAGVYAMVFIRTGGHWRVSSWSCATTSVSTAD